MPKHRVFHLTARNDIGVYRKGDHIEDEGEVEKILAGHHVAHFVRVAADVESLAQEPSAGARATRFAKLDLPARHDQAVN